MGEIVAVLVAAGPGSPLLAEGTCGARPPLVHRSSRETSRLSDSEWERLALGQWSPRGMQSGDTESALVLWWDGALVPEGWDRLQRAVRREAQPLSGHAWHPRIQRVLSEAETARCIRIVDRVVRLARDAEGRLVEVAS